MAIIDAGESSKEPKVDAHYKSLKCTLEPLSKKSKEFAMINTCVGRCAARRAARSTVDVTASLSSPLSLSGT